MATTKLWHIKGRLRDLIEYVENPAKTVDPSIQDFFNVFSYAQNPDKTDHGEYVTAINCVKEIALEQMILTKKQFCKDDGYIAWHGYQSFKPGELTPEECHAIGVQTAKEMWGDSFQIIVTTHLDREHLHNHFCFNSVGFKDGRKYNYSKAERKRFMEVSDRICLEHDLSVIHNPKKSPSRPVWLDEKAGKPTRYNIYREDFIAAAEGSRTVEQMARFLTRLGYEVDFSGRKWKMKLPQYKYFTHIETLNPKWTPEFVQERMGSRTRYGLVRPVVSASPYLPEELRGTWQPGVKTTHIYRLYIWWQYQLGVLPKGTSYKPTSPFMKEELRKLDQYTREIQYMGANHIETLDDLHADLAQTEAELERLRTIRTKLQNQIRRAVPERKEELRQEKAGITAQITELRKRRKMATNIEERSTHIDTMMTHLYENEMEAKAKTQTRTERSYSR
ncbi:MAG: relaxase/mobilization nuclease domain-containing protein [Oscillospiraceae bacterium]|nr:relaxase/mobilization nuclease domain-containing protein [Oscillospiraceae bacterium]